MTDRPPAAPPPAAPPPAAPPPAPGGASTAPAAAVPAAPPGPGPIREVMAITAYRRFWVAQFLSALVNGTLRFAFIWLVITEVTAWPPAAGVLGVALGLPATLLSLPAGAWSDRLDRRRLVVTGALAAAAVLALTAVVVWAGAMTMLLAVVLGCAAASCLATLAPTLQAMVPSLVPRERLTSGVALQNIGMQLSMFVGNLLGGAAIALFGIGGAFAMLAGLKVLSAVTMARVELPERPRPAERRTVRFDVAEGVRFVWRTEPLRSLAAVSLLTGVTVGVLMVNLPELVEDELGRGAFAAGVLFGALGLGMMASSLTLASRREARNLGLLLTIAITTGMGPGLVLLGLSRSYALTLVVMLVWGLGGGVVMTCHRSLVQSRTPDGFMGRVMGVNTLVMMGAFPVGAALTAVAVGALGPGGVMAATGAAVTVLALPVTLRPVIRSA